MTEYNDVVADGLDVEGHIVGRKATIGKWLVEIIVSIAISVGLLDRRQTDSVKRVVKNVYASHGEVGGV